MNKTCSLSEFVASMDASDLCSLVCGIGMDLSGMPEQVQQDPDFQPPFSGILGGGGMKVRGAAGETADLYEKYGSRPLRWRTDLRAFASARRSRTTRAM